MYLLMNACFGTFWNVLECIRLFWKVLKRYGVYDVIVDQCAWFDTFLNALMHSD